MSWMTRLLFLPKVFWTLFLLDAGLVLLGIWSSYSYPAAGGPAVVNGLQLSLAMTGGIATAPLGLLFLLIRHRALRAALLVVLVVVNLLLLAVF